MKADFVSISPPRPRTHWLGWTLVLAGVAGLCMLGACSLTVYGMWWSEHTLRPVKLGMSPADVRTAAGEPKEIVRRSDGRVMWSYKHWWSADAEVHFDGTDRVRAVVTD